MKNKFTKIGLISISDRASKGEYEDQGIPHLKAWLQKALISPFETIEKIIPDERPLIESSLNLPTFTQKNARKRKIFKKVKTQKKTQKKNKRKKNLKNIKNENFCDLSSTNERESLIRIFFVWVCPCLMHLCSVGLELVGADFDESHGCVGVG